MIAASLDLTIEREGAGGITGLGPTVALRKAATPGSYFDWADGTFKSLGWVSKYQVMSDVERGHYRQTLDLTALAAMVAGLVLIAEFHVDNGAGVVGDDHDYVVIEPDDVALSADVDLLRKALTNRLEEASGNPGLLILYDDDGSTPLRTWQLRDEAGGPTAATVGTPARRSAAT